MQNGSIWESIGPPGSRVGPAKEIRGAVASRRTKRLCARETKRGKHCFFFPIFRGCAPRKCGQDKTGIIQNKKTKQLPLRPFFLPLPSCLRFCFLLFHFELIPGKTRLRCPQICVHCCRNTATTLPEFAWKPQETFAEITQKYTDAPRKRFSHLDGNRLDLQGNRAKGMGYSAPQCVEIAG